jgi:hypothetical protein
VATGTFGTTNKKRIIRVTKKETFNYYFSDTQAFAGGAKRINAAFPHSEPLNALRTSHISVSVSCQKSANFTAP